MEKIKVQSKNLDFTNLIRRRPRTTDFDILITENTMIEIENEFPILYMKLDDNSNDLLKAVRGIKYNKSVRTGGIVTNSALLGYKPRNVKKDNFCNPASINRNHKSEYEVFKKYSRILSSKYQEYFPDIFMNHQSRLKQKHKAVLDEYIIEGTPFTSGIVNYNNELKYHFDKGNFENTLSAMITLKGGVSGGYLSLPEFGIGIELCNNSMLFFNGQRILHGVTKIGRSSANAYRYTTVFYSMEDMWKCETREKELIRYNQLMEKKNAEQN